MEETKTKKVTIKPNKDPEARIFRLRAERWLTVSEVSIFLDKPVDEIEQMIGDGYFSISRDKPIYVGAASLYKFIEDGSKARHEVYNKKLQKINDIQQAEIDLKVRLEELEIEEKEKSDELKLTRKKIQEYENIN